MAVIIAATFAAIWWLAYARGHEPNARQARPVPVVGASAGPDGREPASPPGSHAAGSAASVRSEPRAAAEPLAPLNGAVRMTVPLELVAFTVARRTADGSLVVETVIDQDAGPESVRLVPSPAQGTERAGRAGTSRSGSQTPPRLNR